MNPTVLKPYLVPASVLLISGAAALGNAALQELLRYDRGAILHGEFWRILTGNFLHLGGMHFLLNAVGLVLVWVFFARIFSPLQWTLLIVLCSIATGLGLLAFNPEIGWYVGLSGTLHGLFIAGCMRELRMGRKESGFLFGLIALKIVWEQIQGPMPGSESMAGGMVVVDAHLYGAIAGLLAWGLPVNQKRIRDDFAEK